MDKHVDPISRFLSVDLLCETSRTLGWCDLPQRFDALLQAGTLRLKTI
jgi:hypothetical protein